MTRLRSDRRMRIATLWGAGLLFLSLSPVSDATSVPRDFVIGIQGQQPVPPAARSCLCPVFP